MKKIFTIFCVGILTLGLSAQTESGNMIAGVNSNFSFTSFSPEGGGDAVSNMELGGTFGYFVIDNLALMAGLDYSKAGEADAVTGFGVGARYYMNSIFGGLMYEIPEEKMSSINIQAGYSHMLTDNISVEPSLKYSMMSFDGEAIGSMFGLRIGFGLYF